MNTEGTITVRTATDDDWDAVALLDAHAFGEHQNAEDLAETQILTSSRHVVMAWDGSTPVGVAMHFPMSVTVPGGAQVEASGVSWVSVAPTHRRRGILRRMFTEQHRNLDAAGAPLSLLTASEATIYRRFGYGPATEEHRVVLDRRFAQFHPDVPAVTDVRLVESTEASALLPEIYHRWQRKTAGAQPKPPIRWERFFADRENVREGLTALFFMVHPDGYVAYRRNMSGDTKVVVQEFIAVTDDAYAQMWQVLVGIDLVDTIEVSQAPDEPLPFLLTNNRLPKITGHHDALWSRVMNVEAALEARTYAVDAQFVLDVEDPFLEAGGTFDVTISAGSATVTRTDAPADASMKLDVLSSLYFGTHRASRFAASNRLWSRDSDALHTVDLAFSTDRASVMGWGF
ncbi:GNAT family N-acetyltransferase [Rhodococcus sp. PAMC28707]|uniref:GNAT family N-acetyltransferase n=1 Tax=unclassified Rhodococcus (in: high G+C Gram-positive bacteria) TaxID=192944 RepID=UPI00109E1B46|nr:MULTISPECIES: GNAT family N-acetyltransferase [unclassified Rhodococcus (in: high G+C Gram-positive bacteria)]QCB50185.1 GNAT family N-acetyltransferase [Rhodococcus sp. PAMC28705]QCB58122.1 GNAT family N-acetyltransferase [Rhodococcus sp. PAMC28707]